MESYSKPFFLHKPFVQQSFTPHCVVQLCVMLCQASRACSLEMLYLWTTSPKWHSSKISIHCGHRSCFILLQINIGCTTDSSSADPVKLEFSRDLGATWHLLLPLCYSSSSYLSSLCSTEHHPSSTYYSGTTQGWRREVIHFGKLHLCG